MDAISAYAQATKLEPENTDLLNDMGAAYLDLGRLPPSQEALEKALGLRSVFPLADIALGGYNLEGGATTLDALWAGVPVVVTSGSPYGHRGRHKMLEVGGLPEMIGADLKEYERIAVELALNPEKLAAVRAKLATNNATSPLFNVALFTRHFERGLEMIWDNFEAGQPPKDLTVPILD